jgi:hypothetical protein
MHDSYPTGGGVFQAPARGTPVYPRPAPPVRRHPWGARSGGGWLLVRALRAGVPTAARRPFGFTRPARGAVGAPGLEDREVRAGHALAAYRERRRRRRAEDTWFGSAACLLGDAPVTPEEAVHRRQELLQEACAQGMSMSLAEQMYDVAREEGLDPAMGYDLLRCGLGVCPPEDGVSSAPAEPSSDKYAPGWLLQPPSEPDEVLRERMLRLSFRRLRSLLEEHDDPADALRAFAREPDVGVYGY